ncbi:M43 family zinc metalloprotease [Spirosoma sp. KUDC1026]|uniref:M43 family zinc metalloprotease n=1 Tax=Spirosoma sp. KUDC1026 TaxID=2745947 RepID=UPI001E2F689C|nr:M43 family zinc metalloprotease [Spirosoma sp. KUDC1026]
MVSSVAWAQTPADTAVIRCGSGIYEKLKQQQNPGRIQRFNEFNRRIDQYLETQKNFRLQANETIYRIPVVVHVVHSTASGTIGGGNNVNISAEQIISQIQVLNEDYRRKEGSNGYNTNVLGADAGIEFYLATTDPNGQPSTGITRTYYATKSAFNPISDADRQELARVVYWPSDRYLNIWVTNLDGYLGYTEFPAAADTLQGLPSVGSEYVDGSIIDYRYFGRQTGTVQSASYALGRTATHEIGHWLGLLHPNGDLSCGNDYVADTPPTETLNQTTQCRELYSTCVGGVRTRNLTEDYMDYSPDACMNLFTKGQVARMRAVLQLSPRRARLIRNAAEGAPPEAEILTVSVSPNPATIDPIVEVLLKGAQDFTVDLFDAGGRRLRSYPYYSTPSTFVSVAVSGLPTGLYIVRVKTANEQVSKRLLVQ